jgi:RNA polymerase sigma-70 factor, ECF subfamily
MSWFTGRDAVTRFLARRAFTEPGDMVLVPTAANGQPAVAEYRRAADNVMRAHSIHVLDTGTAGVAALTVFLIPDCFCVWSAANPVIRVDRVVAVVSRRQTS